MNLKKTLVQKVTGKFLYYAIVVDSTIFVALSAISSEQANETNTTMEKVKTLLIFVVLHQYTIVT